jgi:hypothetical protein
MFSSQFLKGAAFSGSWLCTLSIDRLDMDITSAIVPWVEAFQVKFSSSAFLAKNLKYSLKTFINKMAMFI